MLHNCADCKQDSTLLLPRCIEVRRAGFTLREAELVLPSFLSWVHMLQVHIKMCPGSGHNKASFCSSQEGTWPGPGGHSMPPHVIFWGPFWLSKCGMKRAVR